jgi:surface antigen
MSSSEDHSRSTFSPVPMPGLNQFSPSTGPLDTAESSTGSLPVAPARSFDSVYLPAITDQNALEESPRVTRVLPGVSLNTSQRLPVVIKGDMKKVAPAPLSRSARLKRRVIVNLLGVLLICLASGLTLLSVSPLGHEIGLHFYPQQTGGSLVNNQSGNMSLVAQATATAVFHKQTDGFDPSASSGVTTTSGTGSLNWPVGQCTYWANQRYHALTGVWVAWNGNAWQWKNGAVAAGWHVSQTPHVPSIIVLYPGVQGASSYGHVAVVEKLINSTTVYTSNMNWYANGGGWNTLSYVDFTTGSGVWFVWK